MLKDAAESEAALVDGEKDVSVLYQGQRWYANRNGGQDARPTEKGKSRFSPLLVMGCFNCDDPGHTLAECKKPVNWEKAARKRVEYTAKRRGGHGSVAQVLLELCQELDVMGQTLATNGDNAHDGGGSGADLDAESLFLALTDAKDDGKPAPADNQPEAHDFTPRK